MIKRCRITKIRNKLWFTPVFQVSIKFSNHVVILNFHLFHFACPALYIALGRNPLATRHTWLTDGLLTHTAFQFEFSPSREPLWTSANIIENEYKWMVWPLKISSLQLPSSNLNSYLYLMCLHAPVFKSVGTWLVEVFAPLIIGRYSCT
jgi:hypothetical protein